MQGLGSKIHLKSPLAPQPVPLKLDSMPPSNGPFSANIHPMIPNFLCPYLRACAFGKWLGAPFENAGIGVKIHLKSPLAPQPVALKLDSMPLSKGPFSANIHPMIPKLSVPIPEGMCIRKIVGGLFRKCRSWGQKST